MGVDRNTFVLKFFQYVSQQDDYNSKYPLHSSILSGKFNAEDIETNTYVNERDCFFLTPMMCVALASIPLKHKEDMWSFLLESGAWINSCLPQAFFLRDDFFPLLLPWHGFTVLHLGAAYAPGSASFLVQKGASPYVESSSSQHPYDLSTTPEDEEVLFVSWSSEHLSSDIYEVLFDYDPPPEFHNLQMFHLPRVPIGYCWSRVGEKWKLYANLQTTPVQFVMYFFIDGPTVHFNIHWNGAHQNSTAHSKKQEECIKRHYPMTIADYTQSHPRIQWMRGHVIDHADGTRDSTESSTNYTPEPPGWGDKVRNHYVAHKIRPENEVYTEISLYKPSPPTTANGTHVPIGRYFVHSTRDGKPKKSYFIPQDFKYTPGHYMEILKHYEVETLDVPMVPCLPSNVFKERQTVEGSQDAIRTKVHLLELMRTACTERKLEKVLEYATLVSFISPLEAFSMKLVYHALGGTKKDQESTQLLMSSTHMLMWFQGFLLAMKFLKDIQFEAEYDWLDKIALYMIYGRHDFVLCSQTAFAEPTALSLALTWRYVSTAIYKEGTIVDHNDQPHILQSILQQYPGYGQRTDLRSKEVIAKQGRKMPPIDFVPSENTQSQDILLTLKELHITQPPATQESLFHAMMGPEGRKLTEIEEAKPKQNDSSKKRSRCKICKQEGHNKRTCPNVEIEEAKSKQNDSSKKRSRCKICKQEGHNKRTCPNVEIEEAKPKQNDSSKKRSRCKICKQEGHNQRTCPGRKTPANGTK
jgi:hypothetical protein